jgi:hypothetical protein
MQITTGGGAVVADTFFRPATRISPNYTADLLRAVSKSGGSLARAGDRGIAPLARSRSLRFTALAQQSVILQLQSPRNERS